MILRPTTRYSGIMGTILKILFIYMVLQVASSAEDADKTPNADASEISPAPNAPLTTTTTTVAATTTTTVKPAEPKIECLIIDKKIMTCNCFGLKFEEDILLESLNFTLKHRGLDQFIAQKEGITFLGLQNCILTAETSVFTNTMYHLMNFEFQDCVNVSTYLQDIMKRRFERDSTSEVPANEQDELVASLKIEYTKTTEDKWPSTLALVPSTACGHKLSDMKNYAFHKLELINIPNFEGFDQCTIDYFPYLYHLDISYNYFPKNFPNISRWADLKYLRCRSCQIQNMPTADILPQSLEVIDLSNNKIRDTNPCSTDGSTGQNCYLNQKKLGHLDLSENHIMFIHYDMFKYSHLEISKQYDPTRGNVWIDFSNNRFQFFPFMFFGELSERRDESTPVIVNAEHNPMYCNCDAYNVKEAVMHERKVKFWANCHLPTVLQDWSVMNLGLEYLGDCKTLDFDKDEPHHKSGAAVFFEVCIAFVVIGMVALVGYWAYSKFRDNRGGRSTNYRHVSMHNDPTTIPYDARNEDVFSIGDTQSSPTGPAPILAIQ